MIKSYLVDCPPVLRVMGTSVTHPLSRTRDPGLLRRSEKGETKSSFKKTLIRLGWVPSSSSGDSSKTSPWPSTKALEISLNLPFLPQPHRVGSLYFLSSCKTLRILPQEGHSNLAAVTCGLTSVLFLTIPSIKTNLFKCLLRISLIFIL